ncbi:hypothetical protein ACQKP6_16440 [Pseudomonas fluorescens]|uniref:hypothetical protein n=1 Tax=Pseudomonas fluorescens TaxID=294 RepID=UPI003D01E361
MSDYSFRATLSIAGEGGVCFQYAKKISETSGDIWGGGGSYETFNFVFGQYLCVNSCQGHEVATFNFKSIGEGKYTITLENDNSKNGYILDTTNNNWLYAYHPSKSNGTHFAFHSERSAERLSTEEILGRSGLKISCGYGEILLHDKVNIKTGSYNYSAAYLCTGSSNGGKVGHNFSVHPC